MPGTPQTPGSTPLLSDVARHVVFPSDVVTSGWPMVRAQCAEMGVTFDAWQEGVGTLALGKRKDGKYAATVGGVVLSIPRQVGKTFLVGMIVIAMCVLFPGYTVLWTAHRTRTATKTFQTLQGMVRKKKIWPHVKSVRTANGEQEIRFTNGSVIMFGAREQGFGRGFDEVDVEVFDEGQILTSKALEDMVPAANQSRHESGALLFFMGTPPRESDPGEEFAARRAKALSGKSDNMVYVEFSAEADADPNDRKQWALANPSFPHRTPVESVERMREQLTDDAAFLKEGLGVWDSGVSLGVIPAQSWADREDSSSVAVDRFALGVEVGPDLGWASLSLAGLRADGSWHVEMVEDQHTKGRGVAWLAPVVGELVGKNPQIRALVADVGGPIKALLEERVGRFWLRGADGSRLVEVTPLKVPELGAGCAQLLNGVVVGDVFHIGQPQLTAAALAATKRDLGDTGMWVWSRRAATTDITPVQSCTYALIGAQMVKPKRPWRDGRSEQRRAVVL